jgi:hypothetical protein
MRRAWAAGIRRTRDIGDFTCWREQDEYQQSFERLLRDLKSEGGGRRTETRLTTPFGAWRNGPDGSYRIWRRHSRLPTSGLGIEEGAP